MGCMENCGDLRTQCASKCGKNCNDACECNTCHDDPTWKVTKPKRYSNRGGCTWVAEDFQRCKSVKGISGRSGKEVKAKNACMATCGKCKQDGEEDKRRLSFV